MFLLESKQITDDAVKRARLLTACGKKAYTLFRSLVAPAKLNEKSFSELLEVMKSHKDPKPSKILSRFRFSKCHRGPSQTVADFIAELRRAAEHCEFGTTLEDRLMEQLVCGIADERIQRHLLAEPQLDFAKAQQVSMSLEMSTRDAHVIAGQSGTSDHAAVHAAAAAAAPVQRERCWRCDRPNHSPDVCRFRNLKCRNCGQFGHIQRACTRRQRPPASSSGKRPGRRRQPANNVTGSDEEEDWDSWAETDAPVGQVFQSSNHDSAEVNQVGGSPPFTCYVNFQRTDVTMEIDTGSRFTLIGEDTFKSLTIRPRLRDCRVQLRAYTQDPIPVLGEFRTSVKHNNVTYPDLKVIVVKGSRSSLLGRDWLEVIRVNWCEVRAVFNTAIDQLKEKYRHVFEPGLGELKGVEVKLEVDRSVPPKFFRPRSLPYVYREKVEQQLEQDVKAGILVPVQNSQWAAPLVPVLKKSGEIRVCANFKLTANRAVKMDQYPLPLVEDIFAQLAGGVIFSKIDLAQAYNQITIHKDSRDVLTISTAKGPMSYARLPFGISAGPGIFQREIEKVLSGLPSVAVYLDDILVSSRSEKEHLETLDEVLRRLQEAGLKVRASKCQFMMPKVEYLGHVIDKDCIRPTPAKVSAIKNAPSPKTVKQLLSFLGMVTYYSKYLPSRADKLAPLYELLRKDSRWRWGREQQESFRWAQNALTSDSFLAHFKSGQQLVLVCDASPVGIGAVLAQREADGSERPLGYVSRSLTQAERRYAQIDREALSIVFGVCKFHKYLLGNHFALVTDHKPLLRLFGEHQDLPTMTSARIRRWALKLSTYSYRIEHRSTELMGNADALSRIPLPSTKSSEPEELVLLVDSRVLDAKRIARLTSTDHTLSRIVQMVQYGEWCESDDLTKPFVDRKLELSVTAGVLMWGHRIIVPQRARAEVLTELHTAHPGMRRMKALARGYVWWPRIDADIEDVVRRCQPCQESRPAPDRAPLSMWPWPDRPWSRIHVDFAEPVRGRYVLVVVDAQSKWVEAELCASIGSGSTIKHLRKLFCRWGLPDMLVSDNATTFTSEEFQTFLSENGVEHRTIEPRHSQGNGMAERVVKEVKLALQRCGGGQWDVCLANWLFHQRIAPHSTTGVPPAELMLGRRLRSKLDLLRPNIRTTVVRRQVAQKENHDGKRWLRTFDIDDEVYAQNFALGRPWLPGVICAVDGPVSYVVRLEDGRIWRRHIDQIRTRRRGSVEHDLPPPDEVERDFSPTGELKRRPLFSGYQLPELSRSEATSGASRGHGTPPASALLSASSAAERPRPPAAPAAPPPSAPAAAESPSKSARPAVPDAGEASAAPTAARSGRAPRFRSPKVTMAERATPEPEYRAASLAPGCSVPDKVSDFRVDFDGGGKGGLLGARRYPARERSKPDFFVGK